MSWTGFRTVASTRSFPLSSSRITINDREFCGSPRMKTMLAPSGEKLTRVSTSNARSRDGPPRDATCINPR